MRVYIFALLLLTVTPNISDAQSYWESVIPKQPYLNFSQGWKMPGSDTWIMKIGYNRNSTLAIGDTIHKVWRRFEYPRNERSYMDVRDVAFVSKDAFYLLIPGWDVLYTDNGGRDWQKRGAIPSTNARNIKFVNNNCGFVYGYQTLYRTTDGGKTWEDVVPSLTHDTTITDSWIAWNGADLTSKPDTIISMQRIQISQMYFKTPKIGYIRVNYPPYIRKTSNGGKSWKKVTDKQEEESLTELLNSKNPNNYTEFNNVRARYTQYYSRNKLHNKHMYDINYVGGTFYAIGYEGLLIKSDDQGKSWKMKNTNGYDNYSRMFVLDKENMLLVNNNSSLKKYNARSDEFKDLGTLPSHRKILDIYFLNKNEGVAVDQYGMSFYTDNGGEKWESREDILPQKKEYFTVAKLSFTNGKVKVTATRNYGNNVYFYEAWSSDKGKSWELKSHTLSSIKYVNDFVETKHGFVFVSSYGCYFLSKPEAKPIQVSSASLFKVKFFDDKHGVVVGNMGAIMESNDGGRTWKDAPNIVTTMMLNSVAVSDKAYVVVGNSGTIIRREIK